MPDFFFFIPIEKGDSGYNDFVKRGKPHEVYIFLISHVRLCRLCSLCSDLARDLKFEMYSFIAHPISLLSIKIENLASCFKRSLNMANAGDSDTV